MDIRKEMDKPIEDLIFDRAGVETFKDSILSLFEQFIKKRN